MSCPPRTPEATATAAAAAHLLLLGEYRGGEGCSPDSDAAAAATDQSARSAASAIDNGQATRTPANTIKCHASSGSPDLSVATASTASSSTAADNADDDCSAWDAASPPVMAPTNEGGDVNLSWFLGKAAEDHTDQEAPPHCIRYNGWQRRLYLSDEFSNSKQSIRDLKALIRTNARGYGVGLNVRYSKEKGKHERLYFRCHHGGKGEKAKREPCDMKFTLNFDPVAQRWYLIVGSGCPTHSPHGRVMDERDVGVELEEGRSTAKGAVQKRKRRRKSKEGAQNRALAQLGISPETFPDETTLKIVAAAAMAASVPKSKPAGEGTCYLCIPVGVTNSDQMLELATCTCDSFQSQHYWLGPAPKLSCTNAVSVITDEEGITTSNEVDDIAEPQSKPTRAKSKRPPFEIGINRRTKQIDEMAAQNFNSNLPFFDQQITKPVKALEAEERPDPKYQFISFSGFPANSLPGSQSDVKNDFPLFQLRKEIIKAGKNVYASVWKGESESFFIKSSSKYYTLLLRDPNKEGNVCQSGICSIYFRPLETTKYWWLSYLTTVKDSTTSRKGYGTMMIWRMINLARKAQGVEEIWLEVQPDLTGVQQMYERLGFEPMQWKDLPSSIANYEMEFPDVDDPHKTKKERVYKHWGEFVLMRLDLSIFPSRR